MEGIGKDGTRVQRDVMFSNPAALLPVGNHGKIFVTVQQYPIRSLHLPGALPASYILNYFEFLSCT